MKTCFRCGASRALEDFYRHPMMADGHLGKCKACTRADVRRRRLARLDAVRAYDRARASRPARRACAAKVGAAWCAAHPGRKRTHADVQRARRAGLLVRPDHCAACWTVGRVEAHHADYGRPLDVVWLCKPCHAIADRERRRQERAA